MPQLFTDNNITYIGWTANITKANIANNFNDAIAYNKDDLVWYNGKLYRSKNGSFGVWNDDDWEHCNISDVVSDKDYSFVKLGNKKTVLYTLYNYSAGTKLNNNGDVIADPDYTLYRYDITNYRGKYIYCSADYILSKTPSATGRLCNKKSNEIVYIPENAVYIIVSNTTQVYPEIFELNESAKQTDVIGLAQKDELVLFTTSPGSGLNEDGSASTDPSSTIYRYAVSDLVGKYIYIPNGYCVFSTTASANNRLTKRLDAGYYIVPNETAYILCADTVVAKAYAVNYDETVKKSDYEQLNTTVKNIETDVVTYSNPIFAYNTSNNMWITAAGTAEAMNGYRLVRFEVSNYVGKTLRINADCRYCFSTTASASNHITTGLTNNTIVVPPNSVYLIVSSSNDYPVNVSEAFPAKKYGKFGLQFTWKMNFTQRVGDAVGKNFVMNNGSATSDFDKCYPWSDMKLCNIINPNGIRTIYYEGDANFSYNNNTFVEIPKFYFKREYDATNYMETWSISDKAGDGYVIEPWFLDENGNEVNYRYIARYNLGNSSISKTNTSPLVSTPIASLKSMCENNGFELMDVYAYQAITHLFVIETGTRDAQSIFPGVSYYLYFDGTANKMINDTATTNNIVIANTDIRNTYFGVGDRVIIFKNASSTYADGELRTLTEFSVEDDKISFTFDGDPMELTQGISRIFGVSQPNGKTDSVGKTARLTNGSELTRPFSYRGIENIYGNLGEAVDKLSYDKTNHRFKINNIYVSFTTPENESYIEQPTIPKWIRYFGIDPKFPTITLPGGTLTANYDDSYLAEWSTFGTGDVVVMSVAWDHMNANSIFTYRALTNTWNMLYTGRAML